MYRITTQTNFQMAPPNQTWTLIPGANHFDGDMPDAVGTQLARLVRDGVIKVEVIEGEHVRDWHLPSIKPPPPEN